MNMSGSKVCLVVSLRCVENVDWKGLMIKCEVVFDGVVIKINGHEIHNANDGYYNIYMRDGAFLADWELEKAIKYCMEQSN